MDQIPDKEFVNAPDKVLAEEIAKLLIELRYDSVTWLGSVYMVPDVFMGWDTEFKDSNGSDSHREFIKDSPTRSKMEEILKRLIDKRIEFGWEFYAGDTIR